MTITVRKLSILGFLVCAFALSSALFIESQYLLSPCPLCMLQRIVFGILACVFLIGSIFTFKSFVKYIYSFFIFLISAVGLYLAGYQFWLQTYAPPQKISCSASLQRLIELHPFLDALKIAVSGSAECSKVEMTILTISIAGWSTIIFGTFVIMALYVMYLQKKRWI